jgi:tellurite resistance-related uncharacterized protein
MSEPYRVLRFGPGEIPEGLRTDHSLKAGVRGKLTVVEGSVTYVDASGRRIPLAKGESHWIPPEVHHHLEDTEGAAIEVAFHRD